MYSSICFELPVQCEVCYTVPIRTYSIMLCYWCTTYVIYNLKFTTCTCCSTYVVYSTTYVVNYIQYVQYSVLPMQGTACVVYYLCSVVFMECTTYVVYCLRSILYLCTVVCNVTNVLQEQGKFLSSESRISSTLFRGGV